MLGEILWTLVLTSVASTSVALAHHDSGIFCGFPGAPANGQVIEAKEVYKINETIRYICDIAYRMDGPPINFCNLRGSWNNRYPPLCKRDLHFNSSVSQSSTNGKFRAELAVDGNPNSCAQTNLLPRHLNIANEAVKNYWQMQFNSVYLIKEVFISASVARIDIPFHLSIHVFQQQGVIYRCDDIRSTNKANIEVTANCDKRNPLNRTGGMIRLVDERPSGKLQLCEVKVYAVDVLECGKPDVQPHCQVNESQRGGFHVASYTAKEGYQLFKGDVVRVCKDGKWPEGTTPLCIPYVPVPTIANISGIATTETSTNKTKGKHNSGSQDTPLDSSVIIGIAIGVTAASVSTVIVITIVVIITRKYYRRGPTRGGAVMSENEGMFLHTHPSSCGSTSPTIPQNYSDPWNDPSNHVYEYINPETLLSKNKPKAETSLCSPNNGRIDRMGYLVSRRGRPEDADPNVCDSLIDPATLRHKNTEGRRFPDPSTSHQDSKLNSINELEVDAYGRYAYPESNASGRRS